MSAALSWHILRSSSVPFLSVAYDGAAETYRATEQRQMDVFAVCECDHRHLASFRAFRAIHVRTQQPQSDRSFGRTKDAQKSQTPSIISQLHRHNTTKPNIICRNIKPATLDKVKLRRRNNRNCCCCCYWLLFLPFAFVFVAHTVSERFFYDF